MTIADMSIVEAVMQVDETDIPAVKVGERASTAFVSYSTDALSLGDSVERR